MGGAGLSIALLTNFGSDDDQGEGTEDGVDFGGHRGVLAVGGKRSPSSQTLRRTEALARLSIASTNSKPIP